MTLKTLAFLLAGAAAITFYRRKQQLSLEGASATSSEPNADSISSLQTPSSSQSERLQDLKLVNAGVESPSDENRDQLAAAPPSDKSQQVDDIKPELPDVARGA